MSMTLANLNTPRIESIGLPPEQHADRVIAQMMRSVARDTAGLLPAATAAAVRSSDGAPKAQRKLAERIWHAGGREVELAPGKRGRYRITFNTWAGWNPATDMFILPDAPLPAKPWLVHLLHYLVSDGGGQDHVQLLTAASVLLTHHSLSRLAQRHGVRTVDDLLTACAEIRQAATEFEKTIGDAQPPPEGWRVPAKNGARIVLKRHEHVGALVAATIL